MSLCHTLPLALIHNVKSADHSAFWNWPHACLDLISPIIFAFSFQQIEHFYFIWSCIGFSLGHGHAFRSGQSHINIYCQKLMDEGACICSYWKHSLLSINRQIALQFIRWLENGWHLYKLLLCHCNLTLWADFKGKLLISATSSSRSLLSTSQLSPTLGGHSIRGTKACPSTTSHWLSYTANYRIAWLCLHVARVR